VVAFVAGTASIAEAQAIALTEGAKHETQASIIVDATPHAVYVLVTDYRNWRNVFSDVLTVSVKGGTAENAKVRFKSRALEHTVTVQFDNVPDQLIRFVGIDGPPGGKAHGEYLLTPIGDGSRTLVTARLYMDVDGPAALFVREKKVREMRRAKLSSDLRDAAAELRRLRPQA
jgi:hypothetical protein